MEKGVLAGRSLDLLHSWDTITHFSKPWSPNKGFHKQEKEPKRGASGLCHGFSISKTHVIGSSTPTGGNPCFLSPSTATASRSRSTLPKSPFTGRSANTNIWPCFSWFDAFSWAQIKILIKYLAGSKGNRAKDKWVNSKVLTRSFAGCGP